MKIGVITPYYKESIEFLRQCHQSVINQDIYTDHSITHFFISDGFPNEEVMKWNVKHISLPQAHSDNGNTPRGIGSILADVEGYDFIAYLDADNWFYPNHLSSLINLHKESEADVCCSFRTIHTIDGDALSIQETDEISLTHIDTSCYLLHRNSFDAITIWIKMPKALSPICDRIFLSGLKNKKYSFAYTKQKTVAFRSQYKAHYLAANIEPPKDCKENVSKESYEYLLTIKGIKEVVSKLGFLPF